VTQNKDALTTLLEQLRHGDGAELIHRLVAGALQALVDCEAQARIGAGHYERSEDRGLTRIGTRFSGRAPRRGPRSWRSGSRVDMVTTVILGAGGVPLR